MGIKSSDTLERPELWHHSGNRLNEHVAFRMETVALESQPIPEERIATLRNQQLYFGLLQIETAFIFREY